MLATMLTQLQFITAIHICRGNNGAQLHSTLLHRPQSQKRFGLVFCGNHGSYLRERFYTVTIKVIHTFKVFVENKVLLL
jgi:hypothetical protein